MPPTPVKIGRLLAQNRRNDLLHAVGAASERRGKVRRRGDAMRAGDGGGREERCNIQTPLSPAALKARQELKFRSLMNKVYPIEFYL